MVTWKQMVGILCGAVIYSALALAWVDNTKLDVKDYEGTKDDIKWIKACMIKKCWDKP